MGTWYGTLLIFEYGITILILMVMVHFTVTLLHGGLLIRPKTPFQLKVYDVVTKGLFSNPRHQNHITC